MNTIKGTKIITSQIINILDQIGQDEYKKPLVIFNGSSIGQHFRHILDFYNCLIKGLANSVIDYSDRERNPAIESDVKAAKVAFYEIQQKVANLEELQILQVKADFVQESDVAQPIVNSSIGRELMYAYDHALHHLAIVKIGMKTAFPHINLDKNIGVAPSTIRYKHTTKV